MIDEGYFDGEVDVNPYEEFDHLISYGEPYTPAMRPMPGRMPRLEAVLSANIGECSMVSAEVNRKAHELMGRSDSVDSEILYFMEDDSEEPFADMYRTVPLTGNITLGDERPVVFKLVQQLPEPDAEVEPPIYLAAIVRNATAFPVASFIRRQGLCDYVQVGTELKDDNAIVTPKDERGSRKQIVDVINAMLSVDPLAVSFAADLTPLEWNEVHEKSKEIKAKTDDSTFFKRGTPSADVSILAILNLARTREPLIHEYYPDRGEGLSWFRVCIQERKIAKALANLDQVSLDSIINGEFPGSLDPMARKILIQTILSQRGVGRANQDQILSNAMALGHELDLDKKIKSRLGVYNPDLERIIEFTATLAVGSEKVRVVIENMTQASGSQVHTEAQLVARLGNRLGEYSLRLLTRPLAMRDQELLDAGSYTVREFYPNRDVNLAKDREQLLGLISLAQSARKTDELAVVNRGIKRI